MASKQPLRGVNLFLSIFFARAARGLRLAAVSGSVSDMPKVAQLTGMVVTAIVVFGTDMDVLTAIPLGILAGGLAMFFVAKAENRATAKVRK